MDYVILIPLAVLVTGLSAITLARRAPVPCTACRRGAVAIARDFTYRCDHCGAAFRRERGTLVRLE